MTNYKTIVEEFEKFLSHGSTLPYIEKKYGNKPVYGINLMINPADLFAVKFVFDVIKEDLKK